MPIVGVLPSYIWQDALADSKIILASASIQRHLQHQLFENKTETTARNKSTAPPFDSNTLSPTMERSSNDNKKRKGSDDSHHNPKSAKKKTTDSGVDTGEKQDQKSNENKQKDPANIFQTVPVSVLYIIASMLDEIPLYCLEEAFPKEFKKKPVSHKCWKELCKSQSGRYHVTTYSRGNDIHGNDIHVHSWIAVFRSATPKWPSINYSEKFFGSSSVLIRGREYAKTCMAVKALPPIISLSETELVEGMPEDFFLYFSFHGRSWGAFVPSTDTIEKTHRHLVEIRTLISEGFELPELKKLIDKYGTYNIRGRATAQEVKTARAIDLKDFQVVLVRPSRLGPANEDALLSIKSKPGLVWRRRRLYLDLLTHTVKKKDKYARISRFKVDLPAGRELRRIAD